MPRDSKHTDLVVLHFNNGSAGFTMLQVDTDVVVSFTNTNCFSRLSNRACQLQKIGLVLQLHPELVLVQLVALQVIGIDGTPRHQGGHREQLLRFVISFLSKQTHSTETFL